MTSTTTTTIKISNEVLNEFMKKKVDFMYKNGLVKLSNEGFMVELLHDIRKKKK